MPPIIGRGDIFALFPDVVGMKHPSRELGVAGSEQISIIFQTANISPVYDFVCSEHLCFCPRLRDRTRVTLLTAGLLGGG